MSSEVVRFKDPREILFGWWEQRGWDLPEDERAILDTVGYLADRVEESRSVEPEWGREFLESLKRRKMHVYAIKPMPEHKADWLVGAVDGCLRLMKEVGEVDRGLMSKVLTRLGYFDVEYVDPEVRSRYEDEANWERVKLGGEMVREYRGEWRDKVLVQVHSKLRVAEVMAEIDFMWSDGVVRPGDDGGFVLGEGLMKTK